MKKTLKSVPCYFVCFILVVVFGLVSMSQALFCSPRPFFRKCFTPVVDVVSEMLGASDRRFFFERTQSRSVRQNHSNKTSFLQHNQPSYSKFAISFTKRLLNFHHRHRTARKSTEFFTTSFFSSHYFCMGK